jgi:gluconate 5-dehydrogenase
VNNAGIHNKAWAVDTPDDVFQEIMQTNVNAVFAMSREVGRKMISRRDGNVIMISALAGLFGIDRVVAYGTSKTAIIGMMNMLVTEYSKSNVRVNTIAPGWIESEMFFKATDTDPDRKQKIINRIAMEGFGKPEDIGNAAVFLASPAARYVTGVVLPVDGGARMNF